MFERFVSGSFGFGRVVTHNISFELGDKQLMAEILHHLGSIKLCKYRLPTNWCRISSINSTNKFHQISLRQM